jgi:Na+/H+ antiporter NhaD/arsenite permease-like protein
VFTIVVTQFLTHVLKQIVEKSKNNEKQQKNPKNSFLKYICIIFSIFSIVSKEFKFLKIFGTRSTFNVLFLKSLIFLIRGDADKKIQKKRKNQIYIKKKVEGPILRPKQYFYL